MELLAHHSPQIPQSAVEMPGMTPNLRLDVQFGTWDYSHSDAVVSSAEHVEKSQPITFQQVLAQRYLQCFVLNDEFKFHAIFHWGGIDINTLQPTSHTESASPAFQQQAVANEHLTNKVCFF